MPHGKLTVVVESATGINDSTLHGSRGSYCTLQCGSQVLSTHVVEVSTGGSSYPIYHTEFEFEIDRSTNELAISIYSKGTVGDDERVGYNVLDFKQVFYHGHTVPLTAYALSRPSGKSGGSINISLKFKSRPSPYAQNPHAPVRQYSAPPHAAPQYPQTVRNQHSPLRQSYPVGTKAYESYEDGYGSSGSDSSKSSRGSSRGSGGYRRGQSQSDPLREYYENHNKPPQEEYCGTNPHDYEEASPASYENNHDHSPPQPQYNHTRLSPLAPAIPRPGPRRHAVPGGPQVAISSRPRQPIPGGPQCNYVNPCPQQQPPGVAMYADPAVLVYQQRRSQPPVLWQRPAPLQGQQQVMMPQQQGPSVEPQVAQLMARGAVKVVVQGILGGLFN